MDALQFLHQRELSNQRESNKRLNVKLDRLVEYTQTVEEERDELREAVVALVEKGGSILTSILEFHGISYLVCLAHVLQLIVEGFNDLSPWPYSHIRLPDILGQFLLHGYKSSGRMSI